MGPILNISSFTAVQNIFGISALACIFLIINSLLKKNLRKLLKVKLDIILFLFLFSSGVSGVLWLYALTLVPIGQAVLLYSTIPLFTLILGLIFLGEKIYTSQILSIFLGILGVWIILSQDFGKLIIDNNFLIGVIFVLLAAFLTAVQTVIAKKFSLNYPIWITILLIMLSQAVISAPFAFSSSWNFSMFALFGILFLSIFGSIVAFFFYVDALKLLRSSSVTLVGYIEPPLASIWGYFFLLQILPLTVFLGGILVLIAGYITVRSEEK